MASSASTPNPSVFLQTETLTGKYISIVFQSNIRYEGICYSVDAHSNPPTIVLAYVKNCGTEGRGTNRGGFEVPPKDYLVEHMVFLANKIVEMKILAVPSWNMIDTNNLSAQEYHRMLQHYATLNLMSPNSFYSLTEYGPVIHTMASSNISVNQMAPAFGNHHVNANVQCPTSNGKSIVIEPPTEVKGKSTVHVNETGIEEITSSVDLYKDQTIRSLQENKNGNKASPTNKTEDTVVFPSFFGDFDSRIQPPMIISENKRAHEVSSSDKKIGKLLSSSRATEEEKSNSNHSSSSNKEKEDKHEDIIEKEQAIEDHHLIPNLNLVNKGNGKGKGKEKMSYEDEVAEKKAKKDAFWKARIGEQDSLRLQPPKKRESEWMNLNTLIP